MELLRRIIFYGCAFAAIIAYTYVSLEPVVIVDIFVPDKGKGTSYSKASNSLLSKEDQNLLERKRQANIDENSIRVDGKEWEDIYRQSMTLKEGGSVSREWAERLSSDKYPMNYLFFRPYEFPLSTVSKYLNKNNQQLYLKLIDDKILHLDYRKYSNNDFNLGSGLSRYPRPPTYVLYPYRKYGLWILLLGLAFYAALPVKVISPSALRYPRWRVACGDIVAAIMTLLFFSVPILIIGGVVQAFTVILPLSAVFWLISLLGIYSIKLAVWYASYQIEIVEKGITIATYRGVRHFPYNEMEFYQPVVFKPPKWLIVLMWLAALSGRGANRLGGAGRAILLGSSATGSIGIRLKDGADLFIVVTDEMGGTALKGFEEILSSLKKAGISEKEETREIRSLGLETVRMPQRK